MKRKIQLIAFLLFATPTLYAQVLFEEDFDSYTAGALSTDLTGQTSGQGGWYVIDFLGSTVNGTAIVMSEPNKGNVVGIGKTGGAPNGAAQILMQQHLYTLWSSRNAGNDILLIEFDVYIPPGVGYAYFEYGYRFRIECSSTTAKVSHSYVNREFIYFRSDGTKTKPGMEAFYTNFPYDSWISVQLFADYNNENIHIYIPKLNINNYISFPVMHNASLLSLRGITYNSPQQGIKYDNIRVSAIGTLPSYLGVSDFVSSKFNVFPNPVTDRVTITNNESIGIEQIEVFDTTGKTIKSLSLNNEKEVQLNLGDFAAGMYLFHIKTNEGVAVKKVVKK